MKMLLAAFLLALSSCSAQTQRANYSATATQIAVGKGPNSEIGKYNAYPQPGRTYMLKAGATF